MKTWWQTLNIREQKLVIIMGAFVIIFLFYSLVWQPINEGIMRLSNKLERQQQLFAWVRESTQRYQVAKRNGNGNKAKGSLSSIVNRTANSHQITITRMQPQGDDLQVWIDEIAFSQLLQWLERLANNEGLHVKAIDLSRSALSGTVKVRRLQLGKS